MGAAHLSAKPLSIRAQYEARDGNLRSRLQSTTPAANAKLLKDTCCNIRLPTRLQFLAKEKVGDQGPRKNSGSHIDASHSRQPLVKGERLVRYEVNAVM